MTAVAVPQRPRSGAWTPPPVPTSPPPFPAAVVLWLPGVAPSARAARNAARGYVDGAKLTDADGGVDLVVSEIVTNAVTAVDDSGAQIRLGLELLASGHVRVAVWDPISRMPRRPDRVDASMAEDGRGLILVSACSSAWGVVPESLGKTVWAAAGRLAAVVAPDVGGYEPPRASVHADTVGMAVREPVTGRSPAQINAEVARLQVKLRAAREATAKPAPGDVRYHEAVEEVAEISGELVAYEHAIPLYQRAHERNVGIRTAKTGGVVLGLTVAALIVTAATGGLSFGWLALLVPLAASAGWIALEAGPGVDDHLFVPRPALAACCAVALLTVLDVAHAVPRWTGLLVLVGAWLSLLLSGIDEVAPRRTR